MSNKVSIEVVGTDKQFSATMRKASESAQLFGTTTKRVAVDSREAARLQVAAEVSKQRKLEQTAVLYREIAAAARKGSEEQVAASNLAIRASERLNRSLGTSARTVKKSFRQRIFGSEETTVGRATKGALEGSSLLGGLKFAALASGSFIGGYTVAHGLETTIEAATDAAATQRQLAKQLQASGLSFADYREEIDKTNLRLSALSGFTKDDLDKSFTTLFRTTGNVSKALDLNSIAADVARGRHISLSTAAIALAKAYGGQATALKRLGIIVPKNLKGMDAINFVARKFAGQAAAGATAQQKFAATLHDSEVIIGTALLPTVNRLLTKFTAWLEKANESGRLQRGINTAVRDGAAAMHILISALQLLRATLAPVVAALGGMKNTLKLLLTAYIGFKAAGLASGMLRIGTEAGTAEGKVKGLRGSLLGLNALTIAPIVIPIEQRFENAIKGKIKKTVGGTAASVYDNVVGFLSGGAVGHDPVTSATHAVLGALGIGGKHASIQPHRVGTASAAADLGAKVARGTAIRPAVRPSPVIPGRRGISLQGKFNIADLALAQAGLTKSTADDRAALEREKAITQEQIKQAKTLKDKTALYQQLAQIQDQITSIDSEAAQKRAEAQAKARERAQQAREKAKAKAERLRQIRETFTLPFRLQLAAAKAATTSTQSDDIAAAKATKAYAEAVIKSGKKRGQALIDAYNAIAEANSVIGDKVKEKSNLAAVSTRKLTAGLNLSASQRRALEQRIAQSQAHHGKRPVGPTAFGSPVYQTIHIHSSDPRKVAAELQKHAKRTAAQTRGQHGGHNLALT